MLYGMAPDYKSRLGYRAGDGVQVWPNITPAAPPCITSTALQFQVVIVPEEQHLLFKFEKLGPMTSS